MSRTPSQFGQNREGSRPLVIDYELFLPFPLTSVSQTMVAKGPNDTCQRGVSRDASSTRKQLRFKNRGPRRRSKAPPCSERVVDQLGPDDVVFGKDWVTQTHIGNKTFRRIVRGVRGRYMGTTSRSGRARICASVALVVQQNGGRFLRINESSGVWEEAEPKVVIESIGQALNSQTRVPASPSLPTADATLVQEEAAAFHNLLSAQRAMFSALLELEEC